MYGTIARMQLKPGTADEMRRVMDEYAGLKIPGYKGEIVYRSDRNPNEYFMAVVFESKEAYQANAGSPEQHKRYLKMRELLAADPEWHDGEIVHADL